MDKLNAISLLVSIFLVIGVASGDKSSGALSNLLFSRDSAIEKINTFITDNGGSQSNEVMPKLIQWYEKLSKETLINPKDIKLRKLLGSLTKMNDIQSSAGCKTEDMEALKENAKLVNYDLDSAPTNEVEKFIAAYWGKYDAYCEAKIDEKYARIMTKIDPETITFLERFWKRSSEPGNQSKTFWQNEFGRVEVRKNCETYSNAMRLLAYLVHDHLKNLRTYKQASERLQSINTNYQICLSALN